MVGWRWWGGDGGGGGGDSLSLQPSHPRPPFCHRPLLSAASTHDPSHEQWLAELGVGAGCRPLALGSLAHSYGEGCLLSVVVLLSTLRAVAHSGGIGVPSWCWLIAIVELESKKNTRKH
jgi:hypothetical protein